jgi:hypothetical protein
MSAVKAKHPLLSFPQQRQLSSDNQKLLFELEKCMLAKRAGLE